MKHLSPRVLLIVVALAFPALACNLTESASPTAVPTAQPAPELSSPVVGLSPISGPPGTVINVGAAGFPAGSKVNLYLAPYDAANPSPVAQDLTIGAGGVLRFALQLPTTVNGTTLAGTMPLNFTISTADNVTRASAVFVATTGGATATPQSASNTTDTTGSTTNTGGGTGTTGTTSDLFITSPDISSVLTSNAVVVTGSGSALNSRVGVQVLDANYNVLGSAIAVIQVATANTVGPWQTTVGFTPPAGVTAGYIVAYTVNSAGGLDEQASIPVTLGGSPLPTNAPTNIPTAFPTIPAVITVQPLPTAASGGFITATPG